MRALADWIFFPIGAVAARAGITPNQATVAGMLIVIGGCYFIATGRLFLGGWVVGAGMVFDSLDGAIAKVAGKMSTAGAFLDSTLDRLADALLFLAVAAYYYDRSPSFSGLTLALVGMVIGFLISYVRARAESLGFECKVGFMERAPRAIIVLLAVLFEGSGVPVLIPALVVLTVLSLWTLVQRFVHVWKQAQIA
ncbi:MAG: CDP-alcohol phosphatidyltransferase family protein [Actinobacteria bacterium]|nr:CDP-alcohol phosphatidyltransferase family protein [Actinomycetota bacterium]